MLRLFSCLLLLCACTETAELGGAVRVVDGDTLDIGGSRNVRLHGIDAPELGQSCNHPEFGRTGCGRQARAHLLALIGPMPVRCEQTDFDRKYQRIVAKCFAGDLDLSEAMVANGYARAYRAFSRDYVAQETQAKAGKIGLWSTDFPDPAQFRRTAQSAPPEDCVIKGNISASGVRIYHVPGNKHYAKTRISPAQGERIFCTRAEAEAYGWRAARS